MQEKLSIWSSYWIDLSPEEMVLEMEKCGLRYSELSDEHGLILLRRDNDEIKTGKLFKQFAEKHGISFPQGHLWLGIHLCDGKAETIPTLKKWINLFEAIGIKKMVLHLDILSERKDLSEQEKMDLNVKTLEQLRDFLKDKDITICLENLFDVFSDIDNLIAVIERLNDHHYGICLDTGHLNCFGNKDQELFINKAGSLLQALHIADNEGSTDQHLMPFGKGTVNFKTVFSALKKQGYDGLYNYEIPGERSIPLELRALKIEYIRKTFAWMCENCNDKK